jgi:putative membrane protein insertion efficiency factor
MRLIYIFIRVYQLVLSPVIHVWAGPGMGCRHNPTCSEFAIDAFRSYGLIKGGAKAAQRLLGCHPFKRGSYYG